MGDERGDLPHRGPALALDQATLVFLLRRHIARDDLHVGVHTVFPDDAGPDLEETPHAVFEFQVGLERLRDRSIAQEIPEVLTAPFEFSRGQEFPEVDPPEGGRVLRADHPRAGGVRVEDRAASIDQERGIGGDLEQLPEPGLRSPNELLGALAFRDVAGDGRAADQSTYTVAQGGDRDGDDDLVPILADPHGFERLDPLAVPEPRHDPLELAPSIVGDDQVDLLADRLGRHVSVEAFRARVPTRDFPRERLPEDRIVGVLHDRSESRLGFPGPDELRDVDEGRDDRRLVPQVEVFD